MFIGGNVWCLGLLGGKVSFWVFWVAMCVVVCFRWQYVMLGLLGAKVSCWVF